MTPEQIKWLKANLRLVQQYKHGNIDSPAYHLIKLVLDGVTISEIEINEP